MNPATSPYSSRISTHLEELITATSRLKSIYVENPNLAAQVSRRAKALRTALQAFQAFLNDPGKVESSSTKERRGRRDPSRCVCLRGPVSRTGTPRRRNGLPDPKVLEGYTLLCKHYGQPRMSDAVDAHHLVRPGRRPHAATARLTRRHERPPRPAGTAEMNGSDAHPSTMLGSFVLTDVQKITLNTLTCWGKNN